MSWICPKCNLKNFAGNKQCADTKCAYLRPAYITEADIQQDWGRLIPMAVSQAEVDKFTIFYNRGCAEANAVATIPELDEKIKALEAICLEGKATLQGYQRVRRERVDKLDKDERAKLITNAGIDVVDSDSLIKKRTERLSVADREYKRLAGLGLDDEVIKELMKNVKVNEAHQTASQVVSAGQAQAFSFNADKNARIVEELKTVVTETVTVEEEPSNFLEGLFK